MISSNDPTYGASVDLIQQVTGAPASTARRWKRKPDTMPSCAARLVRFAVFGDLEEIFGDAWHGFRLGNDRKLYPPFFRGGFTPEQICAMFFEVRELRWLRREVASLAADLYDQRTQLWALSKISAVKQLGRCRT